MKLSIKEKNYRLEVFVSWYIKNLFICHYPFRWYMSRFFNIWDFMIRSFDTYMPWSMINFNFTKIYTKTNFKKIYSFSIYFRELKKNNKRGLCVSDWNRLTKKQCLGWSGDVGGWNWGWGSWIYGGFVTFNLYPKQLRLTTSSDPSVELATIYLVPLRVVNQFVILIASLY